MIYDNGYNSNKMSLVDRDWFKDSLSKHSQADIDSLTMTISNGTRKHTLVSGDKKKTIHAMIKDIKS